MEIRDRIRELRRVPAGELRRNPRNWRLHPPEQHAALRAVLEEIGFAGALLARVCDDGELELLDGHLRLELLADALVPVLVLDVDADEADKVLATHDAFTPLAQVDSQKYQELRQSLQLRSPALQAMLTKLTPGVKQSVARSHQPVPQLLESYELVVTCRDETDQQQLYEQLAQQGYSCRVLTL